jgi:uncharacterized protein YegL
MTATVLSDAMPGRTSLDVTNPGPFAPCAVAIDVSSSMSGSVAELNAATQQLVGDLQGHELARNRADVAVITFATEAKLLTPMTIARDLSITAMSASGSTAMGKALELALDTVDRRQDEYRASGVKANVPMVFLLTDGEPTDAWQAAAARVRRLADAKKLHFFGIGTQDANMVTLSEICPVDRPPLRMRDGRFSELFRFFSDSLTRVSSVTPGTPVSMPSVQGWAQLNG